MDDLCGSIIDGRFREQKVTDLGEILGRGPNPCNLSLYNLQQHPHPNLPLTPTTSSLSPTPFLSFSPHLLSLAHPSLTPLTPSLIISPLPSLSLPGCPPLPSVSPPPLHFCVIFSNVFAFSPMVYPSQFRLKRCGLRRPIYLVEECGSAAAHLSLPESTLQQAIINTQVHHSRTHT